MPELAPAPRAIASRAGAGPAAALHSLGVAVPAGVRGNAPIAARLDVSEEWIVSRTGVHERHVAAPGELLYALAAEAGGKALAAAGLDPERLDLVIVATMSHEQLTPAAAALVAAEVGALRAGAIDLNAACSGFLSALGMAAAAVESGRMEHVLVIGADLLSRLTDPDDRATAALFGDGAGAVLVGRSSGRRGLGPLVMGADGRNAWLVRAGREEGLIRMKGHDTFRHAVARLSEATEASLEAAGLRLQDVDLFAYHQANSRIIAAVGERLGLPRERVIDCVGSYGNTSAASLPLALAEAQRLGLLEEGSRVLLAAFGGGLTWAAATAIWGRDDGD